jgi:glucan 1,3-beta-glucosidase
MQNNPTALSSFLSTEKSHDPTFNSCFLPTCDQISGLVIRSSSYIVNQRAGLYSFFDNYDSGYIITGSC